MYKNALNTLINAIGTQPVNISLSKSLSEPIIRYLLIKISFSFKSLNCLPQIWYCDNSNDL